MVDDIVAAILLYVLLSAIGDHLMPEPDILPEHQQPDLLKRFICLVILILFAMLILTTVLGELSP